ncbi:MAG: hypothetical protein WAM60_17890 [Candidatus Promineifilaceae bacterium]
MIDKKISNHLSRNGFLFLMLCLIFLLGACGPAEEENNNANGGPNANEGYPANSSNINTGYPEAGPTTPFIDSSYPPPLASDKPLFQLDLPLKVGDTTVTGQAPESLPLAIVDITFNGIILGTGNSDEDGRFSIPVTTLEEGHRVGVTITELESGDTFEEIAEQYFPYRGEGFMNIPNVGIFYDSTVIEP